MDAGGLCVDDLGRLELAAAADAPGRVARPTFIKFRAKRAQGLNPASGVAKNSICYAGDTWTVFLLICLKPSKI